MSPGLSPRLYRILLWLYDWTVSSKHLGFQLPSLLIFAQFRAADQAGFVSFWTHINIVPRIVSYRIIHPFLLNLVNQCVGNISVGFLSISYAGASGIVEFLWPPCVADADIICLPCGFFIFFYSSPNLSGRRLDVYRTSTHGVVLVRIQNAGLKCAPRGLLEIRDAKMMQKIAICAPSHNFVGLYLRN